MALTENEYLPDTASDEFMDYVLKKPVDCICPKCRCIHTMQMHWIGDFTPWKYCKRCRSNIESDSTF